jgi:leader peptidase (prepilin peptidase)/N-methyltransferase
LIYLITNWSLKSLKYNLGPFTAAYLALDLLTIASAVGAWYLYGISWQTLAAFTLVLYALLISLTDFRFQVIPDRLILPGIALGLLVAGFSDHIGLLDAVVGGAFGLALFYMMADLGQRLLKKPSMGGGDIKLAAMIGVFLGWQKFLLVVLLASILGLVFALHRRLFLGDSFRSRVPFGPFLIYAALIAFVFGDKVIQLYLIWVGLSR